MRPSRGIAIMFAPVLLGACGSSTPSAPDAGTTLVALGAQVLRIGPPPCMTFATGTGPFVYTRVTVSRAGSGWIASASGASGTVQLRFQQSGPVLVAGSMPVAGTVTGTAVHLPELVALPPWQMQVAFGTGGATFSGFAFASGSLGASAAGLDGFGSGSVTVTDATGNSCSGSGFSWSIFAQP